MMKTEKKKKKDKAIGIIGTVVFHLLLLLFFILNGLSQPVPLPEQEGAMIELGWTDSGSGNVESEVISEEDVVEEVAPTVSEPVEETVEEVVEEVVTQEDSPIAVPEETKSEPVKPAEPVKEPDPQPTKELQDAMDNIFNTPTGGGSEGEDEDGPGNTGRPDGSPAGKGVMGGTGNSWELAGRGYLGGVTVTEKPKEEGIVVLNIWVGRDGKVTRSSPDLSRSTTVSTHLFNLAKKAAASGRFSSSSGAAVEQKGKLTFHFVLE